MSRTIIAFADLIDLASASMGGRALICSDDFFAGMDNLVNPDEPVFDPDAYTDRGKLMDGWESRRRRSPGHDWAIVELGVRGVIRGVDIDTAFFMGNHPPYGGLDGAVVDDQLTPEQLRDEVEWVPLLRQVPLERGSHNLFAVDDDTPYTHVRLHQYPDGGISRLRVYGIPKPRVAHDDVIDLAAAVNGGRPVGCSDMFFSPMINLISPGRAKNMGGGWESRRRRDDGHDWIVIQLGVPGIIDKAVLDTHYFKGNFPHTASLQGLWWPDAPIAAVLDAEGWTEFLPQTRLKADTAHEHEGLAAGPFTHVRLRIYPCGGVSRMRLLGRAGEPQTTADPLLHWLNALSPEARIDAFSQCCGSTRWARRMAQRERWTSRSQLFGEALFTWWDLGDGDWREAFTHHPKIGTDVDALRAKFAATADLSAGEQAGVTGASEQILADLAQGNVEYEARFGFIFIVCATGKSASEMLDLLRARMVNPPADELRIAAAEQAKITAIRLSGLAPEAP